MVAFMRGLNLSAIAVTAMFLGACAGSTPEAESADEYGYVDDVPEEEETDEGGNDVEQSELEEEGESGNEESTGTPEPQFTPGMSVNDAINAVPQGIPRVNIDPETLSGPLKDQSLYEPCKLAGSQHFTLKVAVWDGRTVGIDLKTQPNNETVAECIKQQVLQLEWPDRVKSLNTVEFSF
jgi:hypothetical protein